MTEAQEKKRDGRWAIYVRESTEGQLVGKEYNSLQSQEDALRKYVAEQGGEVYAVYSDTESGTKQRDDLTRLFQDGRAGRFQYAVAQDIDRWARNTLLWLTFQADLAKAGVEVLCASQRFDSSTPEGKLMGVQLAGFAEFFSQLTSRKVKNKRAALASKGMWPGGRAPYGYALSNKKLVPTAAEAETVRLIFSLFVEHRSRAAVRNVLEENGVSKRSRKWTNSSLEQVLRNPTYIGVIRQNEQLFAGEHEAILDVETFNVVQALTPVRTRIRHKRDHEYPLAGVLVCSACGSSMTSHYVSKRTTDVRYYRCTSTFRGPWKSSCPIRQVNAKRAEMTVTTLIRDLATTPELVENAITRANESTSAAHDPLVLRERALQAQLKGLEAKEANMLDLLENGGMGDVASVRERLLAIGRDKTLLSVELRSVSEQIRATRRNIIDVARVRTALGDMRLLYEVATEKERGELIRLLFKQIRLQGPDGSMEAELFDHDAAVFEGGSKIRTTRLREQDSNLRPVG